MSGGFSPSLHVHSQTGGKIRYDPALGAFVPVAAGESMSIVGAASGARDPDAPWSIRPLWRVLGGEGKQFVDFQDDVTVADLLVALRENYSSIEHIKRYTTLGMGTDQGKTSNMNGLAIVALESARPIPEVGTTTFRPPYTPVALGVLAGPHAHGHLDPVRRSPLHEWHERAGAAWMPAGLWMRPRAYPRNGERLDKAIRREVNAVRQAVGLCDMSTLGKIDVQGPDAEAFLGRVYCNAVEKVATGRCRYGLMLRDDGIVLDDGTVARLGRDHYYLTSTTGNAVKVMSHLEFLSQVTWPDMRVRVTSVAEQFAQIVLAGRCSRIVLERAAGRALGDDVLPHVGLLTLTLFGVEMRVFRVSFSGELAYEMAVPAEQAEKVWSKLLEAGEAQGIQPYGLEAVTTLRIEKGHVAHAELDGRCTPGDLGLERFVSRHKSFVGRALLQREALGGANRRALVGLAAVDPATPIPSGAQLVLGSRAAGHVTSSTMSPTLDRAIGLGLIEGGMKRFGDQLTAASPLTGQSVPVTVVSPHFYDPEGTRLRG
jgi:sarcosine oxidase subunit alpha